MGSATSINPFPPATAADANSTAVRDGDAKLSAAGFVAGGSDLSDAKADKVSGATAGDLATLDSSGNLADSGIAASDVPVVSGSIADGNLVVGAGGGALADSGIAAGDLATIDGSLAIYTNSATIQATNLANLESFLAAGGSSNLTLTLGFAPTGIASKKTITVTETGSGTSVVNSFTSGGVTPLSDYLLDEGSGTTDADGGSRGDAMTLSSASWGAAIGYESASLDTAGGTVIGSASDAGLSTGSNPFDYSLWFLTTSTYDYQSLLVIGQDTVGGHSFTIFLHSDGSINVEDEENGTVYITNYGSGYNDGNPHFCRLDNDGTTLRLYVDEVLLGTGTPTFNITLQGMFRLGNNSQTSQPYFGLIGRTTLYGQSLTTGQGATLYAGGTTTGGDTYYPVGGSTNGVSLSPGQSVRLKPAAGGFIVVGH